MSCFRRKGWINRTKVVALAAAFLLLAGGCGGDDTESNGDGAGEADAGLDAGEDGSDESRDLKECEPEVSESSAPCTALCQEGCGTGQGCYSDGSRNQCAEAGGGEVGDECETVSDCGAGLMCSPTSNTCVEMCNAEDEDREPQCSQEGAECVSLGGDISELGMCVRDECEPHPNDDCGEGETCWFYQGGNQCVSYDDSAEAGDECEEGADCNDRQSCVPLEDEGRICLRHCEPGADECPEGQSCSELQEGLVVCTDE